jgi:hypothetical protein
MSCVSAAGRPCLDAPVCYPSATVKRTGLRVLRIVFVAALAFGAYRVLAPRGLAWVMVPVAFVAMALLVTIEVLRWRARRARARAESLWEDALLDASLRPDAIAQLRKRLAAAREATNRAHLRVALAELLDADGRCAEASDVLADVELGVLPGVDAAVVRHARAEIALRQGAHDAAREALAGRPVACGDDELDVRLDLLAAQVDVELGAAESALGVAARVGAQTTDADLARDAALVRACALDALGRRAEALALVRAIDAELLPVIATLGAPRVRALIEAVAAEPSAPR